MRTGAGVLAALLVIAGSWGYLTAVRRNRADPRLASWGIWTASMSVAAAGAALAGQWPGALLAGAGAVTAAAVLGAGIRHGDREFGRLDAAGLIAGVTGMVLLAVAPPAWAVAASVMTDLAAFAPTYANGWRGEEPLAPWVTIAAGAGVALAAADFSVPAGFIYPAYELAACTAMIILASAGTARTRSGVAQLAEHPPVKRNVTGSSPVTGAQ
jgi:hypothetical protein